MGLFFSSALEEPMAASTAPNLSNYDEARCAKLSINLMFSTTFDGTAEGLKLETFV